MSSNIDCTPKPSKLETFQMAIPRPYPCRYPSLELLILETRNRNKGPCPILALCRDPHGQVFVRGVVMRKGGKPRSWVCALPSGLRPGIHYGSHYADSRLGL